MNIYVGNLNYSIEEGELQKVFETYGQVDSVKIVRDRQSGKARGYAFIDMPNEEEGKKAISGLNQQEISGRRIKVNDANQRNI